MTANASPAAHAILDTPRVSSRGPRCTTSWLLSCRVEVCEFQTYFASDLAKSRVTLRVAAGIRLVIGEHYSPVTAVKLDVTHAASLIAADDFEAIASCLRRAVQDADLQRKSAQVFIAKVARAFQLQQDSRECRSITGWFADQEIIARNLIRMLHRPNPRGQLGRGRFGAAGGRVIREMEC